MTTPLRIVVAEDEPDVLEFLCRALERQGHEVVAAARDGQRLVDACRTLRPDLIVTDVRMPELDGDEALAILCQERPTPYILITAFETTSAVNPPGVVLRKPVGREDLALAVRRATSLPESAP